MCVFGSVFDENGETSELVNIHTKYIINNYDRLHTDKWKNDTRVHVRIAGIRNFTYDEGY